METITTTRHHTALDGLRGWAALSVVLYHAILHYDPELTAVMIRQPQHLESVRDGAAWAILAISNGAFAVTLFFILSGLVLGESLQRSAGEPGARLCAAFALRRVSRLMPPLVVGVVFSFAVGHALAGLGLGDDRVRSLPDLWDNLTLTAFKVNGATWTIQVEMLVIPFILAVFLLQRAIGPVVVFLTLVAAIHIVPLTSLFGDRLAYLNDALLAFAVGLALAQPWARQAFASRHGITPWLLFAGFVFVRPVLGWGSHAAVVTQILIGGALIGNLTVSRSWLADVLNTRFSQFLGRISYSFYLLNVPVIWIVAAVLPFGVPEARALETGLVLLVSVTLLSVPLAMVCVRYVEIPGAALGRRWARRITIAPSAS